MSESSGGERKVLVAGAGIAGLTAAAALGQSGWDVTIIERKPRIDDGGGVGLTLVANAMRALDAIGVAEKCVAAGVPADAMVMRKPDGSLLAHNPLPRIGGPDWPGGTGITRAAFHGILVEAASAFSTIRCGTTADAWDDDGHGITVTFSDGKTERFDLMVGADGLYSDTRAKILPGVNPQPTGQAAWRVAIPRPDDIICTNMFLGGKHGVVGICPVSADLSYMYIVQTYDGVRRDEATLDAQFRAELDSYGSDVKALAAQVVDPANVNFRPLEWLIAPWGVGRVVLIGDAAHANPPVLAQGAAMGIEDGVVLALSLNDSVDVPAGIAQFISRRSERVRQVVETSCQLARWETEGRHDVDVPGVMRAAAMRLAEPY